MFEAIWSVRAVRSSANATVEIVHADGVVDQVGRGSLAHIAAEIFVRCPGVRRVKLDELGFMDVVARIGVEPDARDGLTHLAEGGTDWLPMAMRLSLEAEAFA